MLTHKHPWKHHNLTDSYNLEIARGLLMGPGQTVRSLVELGSKGGSEKLLFQQILVENLAG